MVVTLVRLVILVHIAILLLQGETEKVCDSTCSSITILESIKISMTTKYQSSVNMISTILHNGPKGGEYGESIYFKNNISYTNFSQPYLAFRDHYAR